MNTYSLRHKLILSLIAIFSATVGTFAQTGPVSPAHLGFIYPISSNGKDAAKYTNRFSFHALAGLSKAETGAAIAGISNVIRDSATGFQLAGISNHTGNTYKSVQVAGILNHTIHKGSGVQFAGIANYAGSFQGLQSAGFINVATKDATGLQLAGFMNHAGDSAIQIGGFINTAKNANVQIAGFINVASSANTQIAGFINVAKKVKHVQIGFINIADSADVQLGIVNINKRGEKQISASIDESATTIAAFKTGGRYLYGILGVGYNWKNSDALYALQAGIGAHIPLLSHFRLNVEATHTTLTKFKKGYYGRSTLGVFPAYRFGNRIEVFAGPTINYVFYSEGLGAGLNNNFMWSRIRDNNNFQGVFIGATGGVQVKLF
ncbi:hypothetical protein [Chitinophaga nivalis]|uniref:DUF5723 domain-containing protein n=1 Tax=Chitinophaga nivalis TaxID=2991709 RepID=A0ABT3IG82_9BACT|nr:hypothetical protein [Chitinophaga nivalis]MCW3467352.1 hypothetical protein [Chitinophaga nivalis]MCW3482956.1 hypothetical protein [Chitinophaga nivalis]